MPGIYYFSVDVLLKELSLLKKINSLLLFGICDKKDEFASEAYRKNGLIPKALKLIKKRFFSVYFNCRCLFVWIYFFWTLRDSQKRKN